MSQKKLGFGLMRLPKDKNGTIIQEKVNTMVDAFMKSGFTYFDTAYAYAGSEKAMKKALVERYPREAYTIADKLPAWKLKDENIIKENQILYFDVFDRLSNNISENYYESVKVYVNGNCITSSYPSQKNNGILKLGEFNNESVEIIIIMTKDIAVKSFGVFGIETETFKYYTDKLQGCDFYSHGRFITANLNTEHESYLYMAIPYDKGLTAYINGKKTTLYKVNDSFCAVKLQPGKNSIKLSFMPPGMVISLIMLIAGIVTIIVWKLKLSRLSRPRQILCKLSSLFCIICFTGTFIFIYIIPTALRLAVWISDLISK